MEIGDVIRTRKLRTYVDGPVVHGYVDFSADDGARKRQLQNVFVVLLLGLEPLLAKDDERVDCQRSYNNLGLWSQHQLEEVLGKKETKAIIKKLQKFARAKALEGK